LPVTEVEDEPMVEPDHVYVIPPNKTMVIVGGKLRLSPRKETRGLHRSIDLFLRSLAEDQGYRAIGVILSGSATDGTLGLEEIKAEGGITFAQDDTAQYDSMPRSAVAAGCVDFELPPHRIAAEIARIGRHPYVAPADKAAEKSLADSDLGRVIEALYSATGVDFTHYKRNTLYRRTTRRMVLHRMESVAEYVKLLASNPDEVMALFEDILINVTSFFRDPETFEIIKQQVFPKLLKDRARNDPLRIWVLGCSTGEEAYSLAITAAEYCQSVGQAVPLQVFATDLNGAGIEKARAGMYPKAIAQDISPERLRRFFNEVGGAYQISQQIRDLCVFARHNVLTEPPFSRLDLISCRNLLIYLDNTLQRRMLPTLHYALRPHGYLWLGTSETIGSYRDLFHLEDPKHKLYSKLPTASRPHLTHLIEHRVQGAGLAAADVGPREAVPDLRDLPREADRLLLTRYAPPGVLVNTEYEILQFRGDTGRYLSPAPGKASLNLLKMLREGLMMEVRAGLQEAKRTDTPLVKEALRVKTNDGYTVVRVSILPVRPASGRDVSFLVLFEDPDAASRRAIGMDVAEAVPASTDSIEEQVRQLTQELSTTREYLQSVIEQQEAANEELQSANEEVQSTNEELQSINEELETSKEEIQSSNEELATVNEELQNRNLELSQSNNDFLNLFASVQIPILMLGPDLRIRRFTPTAEKILNLRPGDIGRPVGDMKLAFDIPDFERLIQEVIDTVSVKERDVRDKHGRWYSLRIRPYRTLEDRIDGAVLLFVDVDAIKQNEEALRRQAEILAQTHEPIVAWELDGPIIYWNRAAEEVYGYKQQEALGRVSHELLESSVPLDQLKSTLLETGRFTGEISHRRSDGQQVVVETRMTTMLDQAGKTLVLESDRTITERKRMEADLRDRADQLLAADRDKDNFLAMLAHELRNPLAPMQSALELLGPSQSDDGGLLRAQTIMKRQLGKLARMIDDLLDVARVSQGQIELRREVVDLGDAVSRSAESAEGQVRAHHQTLNVQLPATPLLLEADPMRLEQIIGNLLDNASKFTPPGGVISLCAQREGDTAVLSVSDTGSGIDADMIGRVFDLFTQADRSLSRQHGGLGIGLTIVRKLIEQHGGTIRVTSAGAGKGSTFTVRLPALRRGTLAPASPPEPPEPPARLRPRRILIADDNRDACETLAALLRLTGHTVETALDGPAAVETAQRFRPEVVLLDIGLPQLDGYAVARALRKQPGLERVRIIAITGYADDDTRRRTGEAGFDAHLVKPVEMDALARTLESV
jgi:two-component system, chemotaxis family, CheB/CheR fusion protein